MWKNFQCLAVVSKRHSITFCVKDRKEKSGWLFCGKFRSLLSKLMFTHSAEQFKIYSLRKWGNFKAIYLSFHWFNDSWIWTRNSQIWSCNSWIWTLTRGFELVTSGFELALLNFNSCFKVFNISIFLERWIILLLSEVIK